MGTSCERAISFPLSLSLPTTSKIHPNLVLCPLGPAINNIFPGAVEHSVLVPGSCISSLSQRQSLGEQWGKSMIHNESKKNAPLRGAWHGLTPRGALALVSSSDETNAGSRDDWRKAAVGGNSINICIKVHIDGCASCCRDQARCKEEGRDGREKA